MQSKSKPYNNGQWTEARFHSFIKSALRSASNRWGPKQLALKKAWVKRGVYKCVGFNTKPHNVTNSIILGGKRVRNVFVDHIHPVVPISGFDTWNDVIKRMFCEINGLQVLCKECHDNKTKQEKEQRKKYNDTKNKSSSSS